VTRAQALSSKQISETIAQWIDVSHITNVLDNTLNNIEQTLSERAKQS
jgi:hypothetical protein